MPYTEEQLHDIMDIDGPPTIRQLALQNLRNREQEAQQQSPPMAPTMLGQEEEEDDESVYEEEGERGEEASSGEKEERGPPATESVQLHAAAPPVRPAARRTPWVPFLLITIGIACIAMIVARCK